MAALPLAELLIFPAFLLFARLGAAVMVFPALSDPSVNVRARLLFTVAAVMILYPLLRPVLPPLPPRSGDVFLLLFGEIYIGILLGLGARLMMAAMSVAGEIVAFLAGFQSATLFDPQSGTNTAAPTIFLTLCASMVLLALNLHHQMIAAVVESYAVFKPGALPDSGDVSAAVTALVATLMKLGLQLAAPVVVAGLLSNALFGVLNRLIPQLQIFFVSVPVSISLSLLVLAAGLGTMLQLWAGAAQDRLTVFQVESAP